VTDRLPVAATSAFEVAAAADAAGVLVGVVADGGLGENCAASAATHC
jgi:hypothetical protein